MDEHPEKSGDKFFNFDFGVIKSVNPLKAEDCLIYITQADIVGFNRYKCSK